MSAAVHSNAIPNVDPERPHVLFLPKWWPNPEDPQLGDFLRKQAQAASLKTKVSVLYVHLDRRPGVKATVDAVEKDGLLEVRVSFPGCRHSIAPLRKWINGWRYFRATRSGWLRLLQERGSPDILHVHIMVRPAVIAYLLHRRYELPYIISEQSSEYLDGRFAGKSALFKRFNHFLFRHAAAVTAVSDWLGKALIGHGLCDRYTCTPNVVPGSDRPLPPPGVAGHFMMVADLVDRTKNVSGVIRAMAAARSEDTCLRLTVIGDGPDRKALEEQVATSGLAGQVEFLGRLPNDKVLDHLATAGAVIVNSNVETFSVVTGEALMQGKPVIATRCGGPMAFVTPENGILIDVQDDKALTAAMLELTREFQRYSPENIRRSVSSRSSPEAVAQVFMDLYTSITLRHHVR